MPCYGYTYCRLCSLPIDENIHLQSWYNQTDDVSVDWLRRSVAVVSWYDIVKIVCSRNKNKNKGYHIDSTNLEKIQQYMKNVGLDPCLAIHTVTGSDLCDRVSVAPAGRVQILEYFTKLREYVCLPQLNTHVNDVIDFFSAITSPYELYDVIIGRYIFHETCYNVLSQTIIIDQDIYDIFANKKIPESDISKYRSDYYDKHGCIQAVRDMDEDLKLQYDTYYVDQQLEQYEKILQNGEKWLLDDPTTGEKQKKRIAYIIQMLLS